jgi:hypothetical protein
MVEVTSRSVELGIRIDRGSRIRGRVVDTTNQPVPDVWVRADCKGDEPRDPQDEARQRIARNYGQGRPTMSDADGTFTLSGLTPGATCSVHAETPDGLAGVTDKVRSGDERVTVSLPAFASLSGTAAFDDGSPVTHFDITLRDSATGNLRSETIQSVGGDWSLTHVLPGHLKMFATEPMGATAVQDVELTPGQNLTQLRLLLHRLVATESGASTR